MKWMKKAIMFTLAVLLTVNLAAEAYAVTTGSWDLGKARHSIGNAAARILREEQQEPEAFDEPEDASADMEWDGWMRHWIRWMGEWQ